jgi:hypothetical protein
MGFWASLWTLLKPVAREAAKDAASAVLKKKFDARTSEAGKSGKTPT